MNTTNFYTDIASNNTRHELAQRGHNKQGRHNLRQVGLSYVLNGENGQSVCHHVGEEFSTPLARMLGMLDRCQIARDSVFIPQQLPCGLRVDRPHFLAGIAPSEQFPTTGLFFKRLARNPTD